MRSARGGSIACNRTPWESGASTHGAASSNRRPTVLAKRWARRRTALSSLKQIEVRCIPLPRSAHTSAAPLTVTSVTDESASSGSSGPKPWRSAASEDVSRRMPGSSTTCPVAWMPARTDSASTGRASRKSVRRTSAEMLTLRPPPRPSRQGASHTLGAMPTTTVVDHPALQSHRADGRRAAQP